MPDTCVLLLTIHIFSGVAASFCMHLKCTVKLVGILPLLLSVLSSNRIMHYLAASLGSGYT